jgi:hypothetical protein
MRLDAGFPPRRPGFEPGSSHVGLVVDKVAGFLRELRLRLPIFIPPISPQSPSRIIRGWYNRSVVAAVPKVPPHKLKKKGTAHIKLSCRHSWWRTFCNTAIEFRHHYPLKITIAVTSMRNNKRALHKTPNFWVLRMDTC